MDQSSVPKAANLDVLTETVTEAGPPSSATPQMCRFKNPKLFKVLKKAGSRSEFRLLTMRNY